MNSDTSTLSIAKSVIEYCKLLGYRIVTAESCTGGLVAATLSSIPGSSSVLWGGFVVYDRAAKVSLLGLSEKSVRGANVYSHETARNMAYQARALTKTDKSIGLGVTGVAGPGSDCGVQAGTVYITAVNELFVHDGRIESGTMFHSKKLEPRGMGRDAVREEAVRVGLELLLDAARSRHAADAMASMQLAV
jgi:nicotinamide-nucleotide amidase